MATRRPLRSWVPRPASQPPVRRQARRVGGRGHRHRRRSSGRRRAPSGPGCRARRCWAACRRGGRGGCARTCPSCRAGRCSRQGCGSSRRRRRPRRGSPGRPTTAADEPRRRAADGPAVLPRVVGDAVELGDADVEAAELARRGEPTGTAPPRSMQPSGRGGTCGPPTRSLNTSDASVSGQPTTGSSSLMPVGHPTEGQGEVGRRRRCAGALGVEERERVEVRCARSRRRWHRALRRGSARRRGRRRRANRHHRPGRVGHRAHPPIYDLSG